MNRLYIPIAAAALLTALAACSAYKGGAYAVPVKHPEELPRGRAPLCSSCHTPKGGSIGYGRFDHTRAFAESTHKFDAYQGGRMCSMCHEQSSCNDCHVLSSELKPSARRPGDTYRVAPHRGDYRTRHQIDGRLDPASCFRCHGNPRASASCGVCHGK